MLRGATEGHLLGAGAQGLALCRPQHEVWSRGLGLWSSELRIWGLGLGFGDLFDFRKVPRVWSLGLRVYGV